MLRCFAAVVSCPPVTPCHTAFFNCEAQIIFAIFRPFGRMWVGVGSPFVRPLRDDDILFPVCHACLTGVTATKKTLPLVMRTLTVYGLTCPRYRTEVWRASRNCSQPAVPPLTAKRFRDIIMRGRSNAYHIPREESNTRSNTSLDARLVFSMCETPYARTWRCW